ncbi:hypothetical protein HY620_02315 [Candidatus Uhrbacteria bacterium]|nr:hypothetical protein [Candidatus Uhrbacteria bacterium]
MKYFVSTIIGVVLIAIIGGLVIVGSPKEERLRRFDDSRVSDLQQIQSHIISYWQSKDSLPHTLDDLQDSTRGVYVPRDPQSGEAYEYKVRGDLTFELCANFARKSFFPPMQKRPPADYPHRGGIMPSEQSWLHEEGRMCFERTIDKDFFRPVKPDEPKKK